MKPRRLASLALICATTVFATQLLAEQSPPADPEDPTEKQETAPPTDPAEKSSRDDDGAAKAAGQAPPANPKKLVPIQADLEHRDHHGNAVDVSAFPGSFQIPGTTLSFAFGGYVKLDYLQDLEPAGDETLMRPDTIPIEGTPESVLGPTANFQASQSRFSFDLRSPTPKGNFRAFIEIDFFINNAPHLRHAYGTWGHLLAGQTWGTFMDISAEPITADFGGDGFVFNRKALVRWEMPVGKSGFTWAVALEDPQSTILFPTGPASAESRSSVPDVVGRTRYETDRWHFQLGALLQQIRAAGTGAGSDPTEVSWAMNFTGNVYIGKDDGKRDDFKWGVAHGEGFTDYYLNLGPTQPDSVLTPDGSLELFPMTSILLGYQHFWTPTVRSTFKWEGNFFDDVPWRTGDMTDRNWESHVNVIYSPIPKMNIYGEYIYGDHRLIDGSKGSANRLQFAVQYLFGT